MSMANGDGGHSPIPLLTDRVSVIAELVESKRQHCRLQVAVNALQDQAEAAWLADSRGLNHTSGRLALATATLKARRRSRERLNSALILWLPWHQMATVSTTVA